MGRLRADYLADDRRRGDRFGETLHGRATNIMWLVEDAPDAAVSDLEQRTWMPPEGIFHIQHWQELRARVEVVLYQRDGAETVPAATFEAARRALLLRVQAVRAETHWMLGRLALLRAETGTDRPGNLALAAQMAGRLERERVAYAEAWAHLLRAAVAAQHGDRDAAVSRLHEVIAGENTHHMHLCVAAARRRCGELAGGAEGANLIAKADEWMRGESVRHAERMTGVVAPGFGPAR